MRSLSTPSITPAQLVAIVASVLSLLVAFGAPVSAEQQAAVLDLVEKLAPAIVLGDALIRHGRSRHLDVSRP